jgi:hypothetical protein
MKLKRLLIICFLLTIGCGTVNATTFQDQDNVWQAVVKVDATGLFSAPSASSQQMMLLKRGDVVTISLEITSGDSKWYSVIPSSQSAGVGYVNGKDLDVGQQSNLTVWQLEILPEPVAEPATPIPTNKSSHKVAFGDTNNKIVGDIKSFFLSKFGNSLPISAFGQTALHNRLRFDHRNAIDIAVHPDSLQGKMLINQLRKFGVPFIAFRSAVRGSATGPHIHVGMPSHRK